jgi:hypothetical protein
MKKNTYQTNRGAAMMILVFFFIFISLSILIGIVSPTVQEFKIASDSYSSKKSYFLAESGIEDAFYRIKNNRSISASETLIIGTDSATTTITTIGANEKQIDSLGDSSSKQRKATLSITTGAGVAFNYGLQAGNGGITINGGSTINGNVYSNGDVDAVSATITGSAVAANSLSLVADQTNDSPLPPASSINFRNAAASQDFAQSFQVSTTELVNKIGFYIKKTGSPSDATIRIVANNNGSPSTTALAIGTVSLSASQVTTSYGWVEVVLANQVSLIPETTYWVVIDSSSQNASSYYTIGANNSYSSGAAKTGSYSGSWTVTNLDGYFKVYTGGVTSLIGGANYVGGVNIGTAGVGDAWAATVRGASVQGNLYCTTGTNNNKSCNTSKGNPPSVPLPFSESNMQAWKDDAEAGGTIVGNHTIGYAGGTLGPKKITGNLTVNGGGTLTLTGPLWVVGTVSVTGGGNVMLPANYSQNSETIISDNTITVNGGGSIGSGEPGSYLFFVSTSMCPNAVGCTVSAINISGGAGAIAANAQYGNIALSGGAAIKAVVGNSITATGGSTVTYDSGLASPSFMSGPSGGWNIASWKETQ